MFSQCVNFLMVLQKIRLKLCCHDILCLNYITSYQSFKKCFWEKEKEEDLSSNLLFSATLPHLSHLPQHLACSPSFLSPPLLLLHHLLMCWILFQEFLQTLFNKATPWDRTQPNNCFYWQRPSNRLGRDRPGLLETCIATNKSFFIPQNKIYRSWQSLVLFN